MECGGGDASPAAPEFFLRLSENIVFLTVIGRIEYYVSRLSRFEQERIKLTNKESFKKPDPSGSGRWKSEDLDPRRSRFHGLAA